jgi:hypothetical protein
MELLRFRFREQIMVNPGSLPSSLWKRIIPDVESASLLHPQHPDKSLTLTIVSFSCLASFLTGS